MVKVKKIHAFHNYWMRLGVISSAYRELSRPILCYSDLLEQPCNKSDNPIKLVTSCFKPRLHEQFLCDNFDVTIFICPCRRGKLGNFCVANTVAEKLAR